jgi:hypothetical protein
MGPTHFSSLDAREAAVRSVQSGQLEIEDGLRSLLGVHHEFETVFQSEPIITRI